MAAFVLAQTGNREDMNMPMRGELLAPASRIRCGAGEGEPTWRLICDACGTLEPAIVVFSGVGLLMSTCLMVFDPSSTVMVASFAPAF